MTCRYQCGSARMFFYPGKEDPAPAQVMMCEWETKSWSPTPELGTCDWVQCLKPPTPPPATHLRVTDWSGDPIEFGEQIRFVCERGYYFEDDPAQLDIAYTCQDGTDNEDLRGFFDVPEMEEDWPRCLQGLYKHSMSS